MNRRGPELLPPTARRRRLGIDGHNLVPVLEQPGQGSDGEVGRSKKGYAHGTHLAGPEPQAKPRIKGASAPTGASGSALRRP